MGNSLKTVSFQKRVKSEGYSESTAASALLWWFSCLIVSISAWYVSSGELKQQYYGIAGFVIAVAMLRSSSQGHFWQFRDSLFSLVYALGLAETVSSELKVWEVPEILSQVFWITPVTAAVFLLLYFSLTAASLRGRNTCLSLMESISLFSIPYLFGWLLLLASPALPNELTAFAVSFGASAKLADIFGRAIVLIVFDFVVFELLTTLTASYWKPRIRLFSLAGFSAIYAASTPFIASYGATVVGNLSEPAQILTAIITGVLAQMGLWGQTFLMTGILMDALQLRQPAFDRAWGHFRTGIFQGGMYTLIFMVLIHGISLMSSSPSISMFAAEHALYFGLVFGAVIFPFIRTVVESFDGSEVFVRRLARNHRGIWNYVRGAFIGVGVVMAILWDLPSGSPYTRSLWGLVVGVLAYSGVHVIRDLVEIASRHRKRLQPWNVYIVELCLGGFAGLALGWYAENSQLKVIISKFYRYASLQITPPESYEVYPLFSKWGTIDLGAVECGTRLLFNESVSGVIGWSLAAPLFSFNLVFLTAFLRRSTRPIGELFTAAGFSRVLSETLRVERWGLWMAPVIYSFLRMSGEPTWYNQDGAIRSIIATVMSFATGDESFNTWSLNLFATMLMVDWLRILIWFDHMGLRVATLVNLSFIGGDLLDEKAARVVGHSAPSRVIPEGLRRFGTWMPLLIPFYIPRGGDWDYAWGKFEEAERAGTIAGVSPAAFVCCAFVAIGSVTALRISKRRERKGTPSRETWARRTIKLKNDDYALELAADGRGWSRVYRTPASRDEIDLTRKPESPHAASGKSIYILDDTKGVNHIWSLMRAPCHTPNVTYSALVYPKSILYVSESESLRGEVEASIHPEETIEFWRVRLTNRANTPKEFNLVTFRDLVLNGTGISQRHPAFNDLHVQTIFVPKLQAILASNRLLLNKNGKPSEETYFHAIGPLPPSLKLLGYRDARSHVLGLGSERVPLGLFTDPRQMEDLGQLFTFEPVASLQLKVSLNVGQTVEFVVVDGWAEDLRNASDRISRCVLNPRIPFDELQQIALTERVIEYKKIAGKKSPTWRFSENGTKVEVNQHTPRIWTHPISNPLGYGLLASNEGALFSFSTNAQQNPLTPFVLGQTTGITPGQAWYLWDIDSGKPLVKLPLRLAADSMDSLSELKTEFGRGFVKYLTESNGVSFDLMAFVIPDSPCEGRLLKLKNNSERKLNLRLTSCFQMALAEVPNDSRGMLNGEWNSGERIFFFDNPDQQFHRGVVFVAPAFPIESAETIYRRFIGRNRGLDAPIMAEFGRSESTRLDYGYRIAAFSTVINLDPGQEMEFSIAIGQMDTRTAALSLADEIRPAAKMAAELVRAKHWWEEFLGVLRVETEDEGFDRLVNDWLPYQVVASRLWGRTGAYQRSGAFGFRDQLQDVIPLAYLHPEICRKQILLHAAQQFREGDTMQWWHTTWEGKTGIGARNRASDVTLWLPYVTMKYIEATGDNRILDEPICFLEGVKIPAHQEGIVFAPRDTTDTAPLYDHCRRSIDWVLQSRGINGLPKMGAGDWNDGLDKVGHHGEGESIWLGLFLYLNLLNFSKLAENRNDLDAVDKYREAAAQLKTALSKMWRDKHFVRAVMDDGRELQYDDALTSAWPVLSQAVELERCAEALDYGLQKLDRETMILLLSPAFTEESNPYPGRIAVYPKGVRENGGQYSHGSSWLVDAAVELADAFEIAGKIKEATVWRERAGEIWKKISPLSQTTSERWERYGLEPHQQPADIYYGPGYEGRGGWSWYSGSGARMLDAAWRLLGIQFKDGTATLAPWAKSRTSWPKIKRVVFRGKEL